MTVNETTIRDRLAKNLTVIDDELTFIDKEVYLNNLKGTRGFVDILAKDNHSRYVIVELKRSNASSREALHEVIKYFEAIKENKSLKDDEVLVYIVSTEWKELIVPFSKFSSEVSFNVKGFHLLVNDDGDPITAIEVTPLKVKNTRRLHKQCKICLYASEGNRAKGVLSIEEIYKKRGVEDYVLVLMSNLNDELFSELPFMIYISTQELSEQEYISIIEKDKDVYDEFMENSDYYKSVGVESYESMLQIAAIDDVKPWVYADYKEIGYPAKFNHKLLQDEGWLVETILRYGKLKNNELLSDDIILNELKGDGGENKTRYKRNFSLRDNAASKLVKKEIMQCLVDNKVWLKGINNAVDELISFNEFSGCFIDVYNPMDTLNSIHNSNKEFDELPNDEGLSRCQIWIPSYQVVSENEKMVMIYIGMLADNGRRMEVEQYFSKFYGGDLDNYFLKYTATGYNPNDVNEARELGFDYANYKIELNKESSQKSFYKFNGYEFDEVQPFMLNEAMIKFFLTESDFMNSLNELYTDRFVDIKTFEEIFRVSDD